MHCLDCQTSEGNTISCHSGPALVKVVYSSVGKWRVVRQLPIYNFQVMNSFMFRFLSKNAGRFDSLGKDALLSSPLTLKMPSSRVELSGVKISSKMPFVVNKLFFGDFHLWVSSGHSPHCEFCSILFSAT